MKTTLTYYGIRTLWTGTGLTAVALGVATPGEWETKAILILSGMLATLMSILFGGFVKHLAGHQNDRTLIFADLDKKHEVMLQRLDKMQSKEGCDSISENNKKLVDLQFKTLDDKLTILLEK